MLKASKEVWGGIEVKQLRKQIDFAKLRSRSASLAARSQVLDLLNLTYSKDAEEIDAIVQNITVQNITVQNITVQNITAEDNELS